MKKVILLGDSIRMGYQEAVRQELDGLAEVWAPEENGQHSVHELLNFWQWVADRQPDVLHLNAGLWDCRGLLPGDFTDRCVPLEHYRANVRKWLQLSQQYTAAKIIWATCTPIHEGRHHSTQDASGRPARRIGDVELYNATASEEAAALGVEINDLYSFVIANDAAKMLNEDGVHFTPEGCALLGRKVAETIRPHL